MHRMKKAGGGWVSGPCLIPHQHQVGKAGQGLAKLVLAWLLPPEIPFPLAQLVRGSMLVGQGHNHIQT